MTPLPGNPETRQPSSPAAEVPLDTRLLAGFRFACRPDCGLCCYTAPALREGDLAPLLAIAPSFRPEGRSPGFVPSHANGGACTFLATNRCSVHAARPGPCAEFPLSAHAGPRVQLTLVLSCPGVDLDPLADPERSARGGPPDPSLGSELAAVRRAVRSLDPADRNRAERSWARALRGLGLDTASIETARSRLRTDLPMPRPDDLAAVPVPEESEGLDRLPLFFDARYGRVALAGGDEGVELLALREGGGIERRLASFAYPDHLPRIGAEGDRLLRGYLAYVLERDGFVGAALDRTEARGEDGLIDRCREDLRELGAAVVSRAVYRTWLDGGSAEGLDADAIASGIRATDADYLDRATVGRWV